MALALMPGARAHSQHHQPRVALLVAIRTASGPWSLEATSEFERPDVERLHLGAVARPRSSAARRGSARRSTR